MNILALFFSPFGRLTARPFVIAAIVVYVVSFGAQALLSAPGPRQYGIVAFGLAQAVVTWSWFALHAKRLRDADDNALFALAFAILYALAMLLLILFIEVVVGSAGTTSRNDYGAGNVVALIAVVAVIANFAGDSSLGAFYYFMVAFLALILIPILLALAVSIWAATRPTAQAMGPGGMMHPGGPPRPGGGPAGPGGGKVPAGGAPRRRP
jgi:uncharacterized membrane protein YhaH (DUF805 family)